MPRPSTIIASCRRTAAIALLIGAALAVSGESCRAGEWMFRRSYFSHALPPGFPPGAPPPYPVPLSRSAYRPAIIATTPGFSVRGGHRFGHVFLGTGGTFDVQTFHHDWFETQPP